MENNELRDKIHKNIKEKIAVSNIRKELDMEEKKRRKLAYGLTSSAAAVVLVTGIIVGTGTIEDGISNEIVAKKDNDIELNQVIEKDSININSYQIVSQVMNIGARMDIDGKWTDSDVRQEFPNIKNINLPEYLNTIRQGKIFVKSNKNDSEYCKLSSYVFMASGGNENNANVEINISQDKYAINCYWNYEDFKDTESSFISNVEVKIFVRQNPEDKTKISGIAFFEFDNYKYRIESYKISQNEFIDIIRSIVTVS